MRTDALALADQAQGAEQRLVVLVLEEHDVRTAERDSIEGPQADVTASGGQGSHRHRAPSRRR